MRLALAQLNPTIGHFDHNLRLICAQLEKARALHADLVLFPELALCGYPPRDLLERRAFQDATANALNALLPHTHGLAVVMGLATPAPEGSARHARNSAVFLADGKIIAQRHKTLLPTYDVFDEDRYFEPAEANAPVVWRGTSFGLTICEDLWNDRSFWTRSRYDRDPVEALVAQGAQVILNLSASPYHVGKPLFRQELVAAAARRHQRPIFLVNQVGGNDELVFDGHSLGVGPDGNLLCRAPGFQEALLCYDLEDELEPIAGQNSSLPEQPPLIAPLATDAPEEVLQALELGLRDYVQKCGFRKVLLGLSGGIDSALTAAIAARALGPENVHGVALPSRYSSEGSITDARALAENLGIRFDIMSIETMFQGALQTLEPLFEGRPWDLAEENMQSRSRGLLLMALSNKFGGLLLTTGNKSELAVGYCTMYGDMCGGLAVISDLPKQMVYAVSRKVNELSGREVIPESTLTKAPSAELRPDQKDQDSLPPYEVLDPILEAYVEDLKTVAEIVGMGFEPATVSRVVRLIETSEYKRRQAAPGLRVTSKAFGVGRRVPVAQRFREG